jgi:hypothetical protein
MGDFELERLLRSMRVLLMEIKENICSPHTYDQADQGYDQPRGVAILSEPDPHPAICEYYKAENSERPEKTTRERVRLGIEIITLFAAVVAAVFTAGTLKQVMHQAETMDNTLKEVRKQTPEVIKSANAAASAAESSRRSLRLFEFQQRAWISLTQPPTLSANGAEFTFRNFGNSPAFRVTAKASPVEKAADIPTAQERICREVADSGQSEVIFPGNSGFVVGEGRGPIPE